MREFDEAAQDNSAAADAVREAAPNQARDQDEFEPRYNPRNDDRYEPSLRADPSYHSRSSRHDYASPPTTPADDLPDALGDDIESVTHPDGADLEASSHAHDSRYDEYENEAPDSSDDHAYGEEYEDEYPSTRRRSGFILVAALFGLAVLGTAGAFAYRTMFGGPILPSLPPIIRAEGGPNKIVPSGATSQGGISRPADANSAGSGERLVSREEQPVDVPAPTSTRPRAVSTVPIFPDPAPPPGGSASAFPPSPAPSAQPAPGARVEGPPAASVPPANAPSANATAAPAATPAWPTPQSTTPAAAAPKKIRTVSIRADQPSSAESAANLPAGQAAPMRSAGTKPAAIDANGPLSIVPSSGDTATAPAARPRTAAAHAVPLNKPATNETASAAPVASSGGYAVQLSSQGSEAEARSSFRALQAKYPNLLGGRESIVRRADLGEKGVYYRAMVGPFASREQATDLCSNLKAAGGNCIVQKN